MCYHIFIIMCYHIIITLLLHYYYIIITNRISYNNDSISVMQRVSLYYYTDITHSYAIITPGSITTHYYLFQSPKLADDTVIFLMLLLSICPG